jgi:hypothetical protein
MAVTRSRRPSAKSREPRQKTSGTGARPRRRVQAQDVGWPACFGERHLGFERAKRPDCPRNCGRARSDAPARLTAIRGCLSLIHYMESNSDSGNQAAVTVMKPEGLDDFVRFADGLLWEHPLGACQVGGWPLADEAGPLISRRFGRTPGDVVDDESAISRATARTVPRGRNAQHLYTVGHARCRGTM